jgi:hypothetical protein
VYDSSTGGVRGDISTRAFIPLWIGSSPGLNFPIHTRIESTSTTVLFIYPPHPVNALPLAWPVLLCCSSSFVCSLSSEGSPGIFPVTILDFNLNPLYYSFLPFSSSCVAQQFSALHCVCSYMVQCISVLFTPCHSLLLSLLHYSALIVPFLETCFIHIDIYLYMWRWESLYLHLEDPSFCKSGCCVITVSYFPGITVPVCTAG